MSEVIRLADHRPRPPLEPNSVKDILAGQPLREILALFRRDAERESRDRG